VWASTSGPEQVDWGRGPRSFGEAPSLAYGPPRRALPASLPGGGASKEILEREGTPGALAAPLLRPGIPVFSLNSIAAVFVSVFEH